MPGFNYGGKGDGTSWSSERGSGPEPGGGHQGNSGRENSHNHTNRPSPQQQQIAAIRSDPVVRQKLSDMIKAARRINPYAKLTIVHITPEGVMSIAVSELTIEQAKQIGLGGLMTQIGDKDHLVTLGSFETGHKLPDTGRGKHNSDNHSSAPEVEKFLSASPEWSHNVKTGTYSSTKYEGNLNQLKIDAPDRYTIILNGLLKQPVNVTINNGNVNNISTKFNNWRGPKGNYEKVVKEIAKDFYLSRQQDEKALLTKTSEIIVDAGQKLSAHLGDKYNNIAKEIANNIKNFQGKRIRSFNDAMKSLNKVITNPAMKINKKDRDALVKAWEHLNARDMAFKFSYLGKMFRAADVIMKVEKIREKSILGYKTGDWGPLLLEVESWVLSGITAGVALGIFASLVVPFATTIGLPSTAIIIAGIVGISYLASMIDDKLVDKINKEIIRPAH